MEQQIRFCTSADSTRIAFATMGEGPPLVLYAAWGHRNEHYWNHPESRAALEKLTAGRQFVHYDARGIGASQRPGW